MSLPANLSHKLPRREQHLPYEVRDAVDLDSFRIQETYSGALELEKENGQVGGFSDGMKYSVDDEKDLLSHIVAT